VEKLIIRTLGSCDYQATWDKMKAFTDERDESTSDEVWLLEHPPVFTQGLAGKPEHVLNLNEIPLICTDRGGQVTYHGPGQLVAYVLLDLRRLKIGVRQLVHTLEACVIDVLAEYGVVGKPKCDAPGVYVYPSNLKEQGIIEGAKICSIGLRVRKGCSYHGIAFNIDMDLSPFSQINPCGYQGLPMAQLRDFANVTVKEAGEKFVHALAEQFNYDQKVNP
jgi:lipoyl(octanoyl) transferase